MSFLIVLIMLVSLYVNPAIWVSDYPPDIRQKFGSIDDSTQKLKKSIYQEQKD